ncbi:hypothetical protein DPMN_168554 [Dreissena polymorpha]|uniref:Uncharacterized protein n=1 Tax=Dreissena polymorpha TaxID=45954 RepID=A0A9D4IW12_DREPO|nr:hypothetical protein DPMN_168554 [Dreissena polymorpha]
MGKSLTSPTPGCSQSKPGASNFPAKGPRLPHSQGDLYPQVQAHRTIFYLLQLGHYISVGYFTCHCKKGHCGKAFRRPSLK